jgi:hypothetical protein
MSICSILSILPKHALVTISYSVSIIEILHTRVEKTETHVLRARGEPRFMFSVQRHARTNTSEQVAQPSNGSHLPTHPPTSRQANDQSTNKHPQQQTDTPPRYQPVEILLKYCQADASSVVNVRQTEIASASRTAVLRLVVVFSQ